MQRFGGNIVVGGKVVSPAAGGLGLRSMSQSKLSTSMSGQLVDLKRINTYES